MTSSLEQRRRERWGTLPTARRRTRPRPSGQRLPPTHPAWGVAFIGTAGAAVFCCALALVASREGVSGPLLVAGAGAVGGGLLFDVLVLRRARTWRPWMTTAAMLVGELNIALFVVVAPDPLFALAGATTFTWAAVFAGLYLRPLLVVVHVLVQGVLMAGGLAQSGGPAAVATGLAVLFPICAGLAFLTSSLAVRLRRDSDQDALTGLLNRRGLYARAGTVRRPGARWAVAVLDLDGFKTVNDQHGHDAGDRLLQRCAAAWSGVAPSSSLLARTGGDEFVLAVHGSVDDLRSLVTRMRAGSPPDVGVSAGVAEWPAGCQLDEALRCADAALYVAKRGSRGSTATHG